MQSKTAKYPFRNHVLIVKGHRSRFRSTNETTIAVYDIRHESIEAEKDYPAILVQHRTIGSDMKHVGLEWSLSISISSGEMVGMLYPVVPPPAPCNVVTEIRRQARAV